MREEKPRTAKQWNQDAGVPEIPMPAKTYVGLVRKEQVQEYIRQARLEVAKEIFDEIEQVLLTTHNDYRMIEGKFWEGIKDKFLTRRPNERRYIQHTEG